MRTVIRRVVATVSLLIVLPVAQVDAQVRALPGASSLGDGIEKSIAHLARPVVFCENLFRWIEFDAVASEGDGYPGYVADEKIDWEAIAELVEPDADYVLDLRHAGTDDSHLKQLSGLKNVFALGLANTAITDSGLWHLRSYPNLEHLDVSGDFVTDNALESLKSMKNLRQLDLSNTRVTDVGMKTIAQFPALRALRLGGTEVTGNGLSDLAALKSLEALTIDLKAEGIDNSTIKLLLKMPRLTSLVLSNTSVTESATMNLRKFKSLRYLDLSGIQINRVEFLELMESLPECQIR